MLRSEPSTWTSHFIEGDDQDGVEPASPDVLRLAAALARLAARRQKLSDQVAETQGEAP